MGGARGRKLCSLRVVALLVERLREQRVGVAGHADLVQEVVAAPQYGGSRRGIAGEELDRPGDLREARERKAKAELEVAALGASHRVTRLVEMTAHPEQPTK